MAEEKQYEVCKLYITKVEWGTWPGFGCGIEQTQEALSMFHVLHCIVPNIKK